MNVNDNYKALLEGRMSKSEFLRQARQGLPQYITNLTSFDDAIKILRQKSIISEELVYANKADKFSLESIQRGIRYELEAMGVVDSNSPTREEYKKARQKAIENLGKDPLYYLKKVAEQTPQPKSTEEDTADGKMKKVKNLQEGRYIKEGESGVRTNWDEKKLKIAYTIFKFGTNGINAIVDKFGDLMDKGLGYGVAQVASSGDNTNDVLEDIAAALCGCTRDALKAYAVKRNDANSYLNTKSARGSLDPRYEQIQNQYQNATSPDEILDGIEYTPDEIQRNVVNARVRNDKIITTRDNRNKEKAKQKAYSTKELTNIKNQLVARFGSTEGIKKFKQYLERHPEFNGVGTLGEASWKEYSGDPIYTQFYQHYLKKAKEAKDVNAEKTARGQAKKAFLKYKEKKGLQEQKNKIDQMVLKETVIKLIGKVLNEAATANLAQLSDENASVAELPAAINSLENIVTEIESFWLKEQQKIQGVFDSLGNIKNEDGLPIGYKFVQPIMDSLKKDLEPVLAKISLEGLKLPEAPAPDQTPVNDPNAEVDPNDPNAVPPIPEKETVFSPGKKEPLQEADVRKVLDNIDTLELSDEQKKKILDLANKMYEAIRENSTNMYFYATKLHDYLDQVLPQSKSALQENKKNRRYTK